MSQCNDFQLCMLLFLAYNPFDYETLIYDNVTLYLLVNQMLCVTNDEYIFQVVMNDILSCLKHYRLDLMFVLSCIYVLRYSIGYGNYS